MATTTHTLQITTEDAQELQHKLGILADEPDLQADYGITGAQARELLESIPINCGEWEVPGWALTSVAGEIADHAVVLRAIANDAMQANQKGQALRISRQAKRFEDMANALTATPPPTPARQGR